jgi:hypothetical protein
LVHLTKETAYRRANVREDRQNSYRKIETWEERKGECKAREM